MAIRVIRPQAPFVYVQKEKEPAGEPSLPQPRQVAASYRFTDDSGKEINPEASGIPAVLLPLAKAMAEKALPFLEEHSHLPNEVFGPKHILEITRMEGATGFSIPTNSVTVGFGKPRERNQRVLVVRKLPEDTYMLSWFDPAAKERKRIMMKKA